MNLLCPRGEKRERGKSELALFAGLIIDHKLFSFFFKIVFYLLFHIENFGSSLLDVYGTKLNNSLFELKIYYFGELKLL